MKTNKTSNNKKNKKNSLPKMVIAGKKQKEKKEKERAANKQKKNAPSNEPDDDRMQFDREDFHEKIKMAVAFIEDTRKLEDIALTQMPIATFVAQQEIIMHVQKQTLFLRLRRGEAISDKEAQSFKRQMDHLDISKLQVNNYKKELANLHAKLLQYRDSVTKHLKELRCDPFWRLTSVWIPSPTVVINPYKQTTRSPSPTIKLSYKLRSGQRTYTERPTPMNKPAQNKRNAQVNVPAQMKTRARIAKQNGRS